MDINLEVILKDIESLKNFGYKEIIEYNNHMYHYVPYSSLNNIMLQEVLNIYYAHLIYYLVQTNPEMYIEYAEFLNINNDLEIETNVESIINYIFDLKNFPINYIECLHLDKLSSLKVDTLDKIKKCDPFIYYGNTKHLYNDITDKIKYLKNIENLNTIQQEFTEFTNKYNKNDNYLIILCLLHNMHINKELSYRTEWIQYGLIDTNKLDHYDIKDLQNIEIVVGNSIIEDLKNLKKLGYANIICNTMALFDLLSYVKSDKCSDDQKEKIQKYLNQYKLKSLDVNYLKTYYIKLLNICYNYYNNHDFHIDSIYDVQRIRDHYDLIDISTIGNISDIFDLHIIRKNSNERQYKLLYLSNLDEYMIKYLFDHVENQKGLKDCLLSMVLMYSRISSMNEEPYSNEF